MSRPVFPPLDCQQSSCNRNSSVFRPSSVVRPPSIRVTIISEPNAQFFFFKFWFLVPLDHALGCFLNFWKKNVWDAMGAKKKIKTLLLQIAAKSSPEISSHFLGSSQKYCFGFLKFRVYYYFNNISSFSLTRDPMGAKIFKTLHLP